MSRLLCLVLLAALSACGALPQPFFGRPGRDAARLVVPPPPRLAVPVPADSLLPASDSAAWAKSITDTLVQAEVPAFAEPAKPGDWQLRLSAATSGNDVTPRYVVIDPQGKPAGDIAGKTVPSAVWARGGEALFASEAQASAPALLDLLRAVQARIARSDPNSLLNRPARLYVAPIAHAPGDGARALVRLMRAKLPETGDILVDQAAAADFTVQGTVAVSDQAGGQQLVEIHWKVLDRNGKQIGDVAQVHDVPHGMLDGLWGDVAEAITEQAAGGVHEVVANFAGRNKSPPHAGA